MVPPDDNMDMSQVDILTTKLVMDWRKRDGSWMRRARLVARDFVWLDPGRTDVLAPAGGQSLLGIVPRIFQPLDGD